MSREDYTTKNGSTEERVRSVWLALPRSQSDQGFDSRRLSVFFQRERLDGYGWFTTSGSVGFSVRGWCWSFTWGREGQTKLSPTTPPAKPVGAAKL